MNEIAFQNERGATTVLRSVMLALAQVLPQAAADGIANAQRLRDVAVNSRQPDTFLAGMDAELAFWREQLKLDPP